CARGWDGGWYFDVW
nr:immunoglobulin heavy chain junction region [Mus musculus]MBK4186399.1 immunoglobulin heavy chain junction region [Mus musculus]MBK4186400.1 immunoglobulin heavy chain junction region [Mus musculus]MBK4186401.1 immunoglobulin heavy chain junction region [Mus musculus]MBK4186402.1 immunoglobulin heavy chain junction region [Mus musculus]